MKEDQHIQDLLQDQFAQYEAEPDRDLWPAIESGLKGSRRKVIPLWTRYLAVAASLLLLLGLVWLLRQPQQSPQGPIAQQPTEKERGPAQPPETMPPTQAPPTPQAPLAEGQNRQKPPQIEPLEPKKRPSLSIDSDQIDEPVLVQEAPAQRNPGPRARLHLRPESMTPIHHQLAINQSLTPAPAPEAQADGLEVPLPERNRRPVQTVSASGKNRSLNLNELTLASAVSFASDELSRWAKSPVDVSEKETPEQEVKTFELDILNLKITRKIHKKTK